MADALLYISPCRDPGDRLPKSKDLLRISGNSVARAQGACSDEDLLISLCWWWLEWPLPGTVRNSDCLLAVPVAQQLVASSCLGQGLG